MRKRHTFSNRMRSRYGCNAERTDTVELKELFESVEFSKVLVCTFLFMDSEAVLVLDIVR